MGIIEGGSLILNIGESDPDLNLDPTQLLPKAKVNSLNKQHPGRNGARQPQAQEQRGSGMGSSTG